MKQAIFNFFSILPEHQEGLQILKYNGAEESKPHFDYYLDAASLQPESGGQRVVTVLLYL